MEQVTEETSQAMAWIKKGAGDSVLETYCTSFRKFIRFGVATLPLSIAQHVVYSSADSSFSMTIVNS